GGLTAGGTATAATAAAGPVPACLPGTAARRLHLRAGDMLRLRDVPDQITITVRITCTFARRQGASGYWSLSPVGSSGVGHVSGSVRYGPLVTSPAVLAARHIPVQFAVLWAQPRFAALHPASLTALSARLSAALGRLASSDALGGPAVSSRLPGLLSGLATAVVVSRSQMLIGLLILLVIAG